MQSKDGNETGTNNPFLTEALANLSKINKTTTALLSPDGILGIVNVLEKTAREDLLENTTQLIRVEFAKVN